MVHGGPPESRFFDPWHVDNTPSVMRAPADKVLKKTAIGFAKTFSDIPCVSQILGGHRCGSAFPENGSAFHQDLAVVGKTLVDW